MIVPAGVIKGVYDVRVSTTVATNAVSTQKFTVVGTGPIVTGVTPAYGMNDSETTITITGQYFFGGTASSDIVVINLDDPANTAVSFSGAVITDSTITNAVIPVGVAFGSWNVLVQNNTGVNAPGQKIVMQAGVIPSPHLTAEADDTKISLVWGTSFGATNYRIKRSETTGTSYITIATGLTANTYDDTTVTNGKKYYYVMSAYSGFRESLNSSEVSATPNKTVSIQTSTYDGYIDESNANINYGGYQYLNLRGDAGNRTISFVKFNSLAGIPLYADIKSAYLKFYVSAATAATVHSVDIYELTGTILNQNFGSRKEADAATAISGSMCWGYISYPGKKWNNNSSTDGPASGVDYKATKLTTLELDPAFSGGYVTMEIPIDLVDQWILGINFGLMLKDTSTEAAYFQLASSNAVTTIQRPKILLNYSLRALQPTLANAAVFPNPIDISAGQMLSFVNLSANSMIYIYTLNGSLVVTLNAASFGTISWDGKNETGAVVARGLYFYNIKDSSGNVKKGKFAV